jgi:mRNA interferase RelE/StbE
LAGHPYPSGTRKIVARDIAQYRIRVGDYRILYDVDESAKAVVILRIGHRRDIYR